MRGVIPSPESDLKSSTSSLSLTSTIMLACKADLSVYTQTNGVPDDEPVGTFRCGSGQDYVYEHEEKETWQFPCKRAVHRRLLGQLNELIVNTDLQDYTDDADNRKYDAQLMVELHESEVMESFKVFRKYIRRRGVVKDGKMIDEERLMSCIGAVAPLCHILFPGEAEFKLLKWGLRGGTTGRAVMKYDSSMRIKQLGQLEERSKEIIKEYRKSLDDFIDLDDFQRYHSLLQYIHLKMFSIILGPVNRTGVSEEDWLRACGSRQTRPNPQQIFGDVVDTWKYDFRNALKEGIYGAA